MKRKLLFLAAGAALLGTGYWLGKLPPGDAAPKRTTGLAAAARAQTPHKKAAKEPVAANAAAVFEGVRPFADGGAAEWMKPFLLDTYTPKNQRSSMEWEQQFLTMDREAAREAVEALKRILNDGQPFGEPHPERALAVLELLSFRLSQFDPESGAELMNSLLTLKAAGADMEPAKRTNRITTSAQFEAGVLNRMLEENPGQALSTLAKVPVSEKGYVRVREALEQWRRLDAGAAREWAEAYSGAGQTAIKGWALERTSWYDPQSALLEFAELLRAAADPNELAGTARALGISLAAEDLPAAKKWMASLPEGPVRAAVMPAVVDQWLTEDKEAASKWIGGLPAGQDRDTAILAMVEKIYGDDPGAARQWAAMIDDPKIRRDAMDQAGVETPATNAENEDSSPDAAEGRSADSGNP